MPKRLGDRALTAAEKSQRWRDTDEVRELLCIQCNLLVGFVERNPDLVDAAKTYVLKHKLKVKL
jgi:hypothetical protein